MPRSVIPIEYWISLMMMRATLAAVALALPLMAAGDCEDAKTCGECTSQKASRFLALGRTCRFGSRFCSPRKLFSKSDREIASWCESDKTCREPGEQRLGRGACNINTMDTEPAGCPNDPKPWKPYDEELAKKLTRFAARAYKNPQNCEALDGARMDIVVTAKHAKGGENLGFAAVDDSAKAIILSFRGTNGPTQLASEGLHSLGDWYDFGNGEVQRYFKDAVDRLWPCMMPRVKELVAANPDYKIWVTGHSLGGAMASIAAFDLALNQGISGENIRLVTLGQPRTGDKPWARHLDRLVPYTWRVVYKNDLVAQIPFCGLGKKKEKVGILDPARFVAPCWGVGMFEHPFHHGLEIWYANGNSGQYKVCDQGIQGEDASCSHAAGRRFKSVIDHQGYALMWGTAECKPAASDKELSYNEKCSAYRL